MDRSGHSLVGGTIMPLSERFEEKHKASVKIESEMRFESGVTRI
jgi:hypothetical protein